MHLYGIDFTSAPRRAKPITVASGHLKEGRLVLEALEPLPDWAAFEAFLRRPGPWLGGFDFPFGLPREAVTALGWPAEWGALVRHCRAMGKTAFRATLDAYRESRPAGRRYAHRATDLPARSHSPLKLVNPPVGLMFLEGAPRLLDAGLTLPGMQPGDPARIALEAYPGMLARRFTRASYKSDSRARQCAARHAARQHILTALCAPGGGIALVASAAQQAQLLADGRGDALDAVLALVQAADALRAGAPHFGLPPAFDALEGWIAGQPCASIGTP